MTPSMNAAVLNAGDGACFFEEHAQRMAQALGVGVTSSPMEHNYVLGWPGEEPPAGQSFIPFPSILLSADKRLLAEAFAQHGVATPQTYLLDTERDVRQLLRAESENQWVLKWPTGCGASGHRLLGLDDPIPTPWPRPFVLQEFIQLDAPEVYRLYCVAGETFGWNARRFPAGTSPSPFVAHARGAKYEEAGRVPEEAEALARQAFQATNLLDSFGCADLMRNNSGLWLILEANTDGVQSHVDRDIGVGNIAQDIDKRLGRAFQAWLES